MNLEYTLVIPDTDILSGICGTNDKNLKLIEEYLGVPVFSRGNEISVYTENQELQQKFRFIVDRAADEIRCGLKNGEDVIASVINFESNDNIEDTYISIPGAFKKIYPRSKNQAAYIRAMRKNDMTFCSGAAGSGKTFLAAAEALRLVLSRRYSKIIISRPVIEAGENLGFLPGDMEQKINPYLRPIYDAMYSILPAEVIKRLIENEVIEIAPLAYMRGRTLNKSVIILDEAQNTTCSQMKMFLTRMGENSKVFITGDIQQPDLPKNIKSGLVHALEILSDIQEICFINLLPEDIVRNPLVKKIVKAYGNE